MSRCSFYKNLRAQSPGCCHTRRRQQGPLPAAHARARPLPELLVARGGSSSRWEFRDPRAQLPLHCPCRGRIWADCRCSGATARSQAAAAPTLRASWLCSQRLRDALQVWWALPSHMPTEDEWDGQMLELSLGLLPALPAWPTGVHRGSSPCGSSDGLREGCRFRDPEEQRLGGSRRV